MNDHHDPSRTKLAQFYLLPRQESQLALRSTRLFDTLLNGPLSS